MFDVGDGSSLQNVRTSLVSAAGRLRKGAVRGARRAALVGAGAALLSNGRANAQSTAQSRLREKAAIDIPLTMGGAGAWVIAQGLRGDLVPAHCRWCDRDARGTDDLNAFDRAGRKLRWRDPMLANELSNMTAFVLTPIAAGGFLAVAASHEGRGRHETAPDVLVTAEAGVLAADVNQLVKFLVVRERPDAHARAQADPGAHAKDVDDNLSFYSGHTTESASLAVAAGTVASLQHYRLAPMVWATALPLALVTGYLRVAADKHYLTDVLTGAVVGAAIGFLVPFVFHRTEAAPTSGDGIGGAAQAYDIGYAGTW